MKTSFCLLIFFICSSFRVYAQNNSDTNKSINSVLMPNDSIKTGKITFSLENHRKGAKTADKYVFTLLFTQDDNRIKFNITDSSNLKQYIYNGYTLYTIDHKKKKYGVEIASQKQKRRINTSSIIILKNLFVDYYITNDVRKHLPKQITYKQLSTNNDTIELSGMMKVSGFHVKNTKDSLALTTEADVKIVFEPENGILQSYQKDLRDKKTLKKGTILMSEYTLLSFTINETRYTLPQYYEGLFYAKGYKLASDYFKFNRENFYNW